MEEIIKRFVMPSGHTAEEGSIVIFDNGGYDPMIGQITKLYKREGFVFASIKHPSGRRRERNLEYDANKNLIVLIVGDDARALRRWFDTLED